MTAYGKGMDTIDWYTETTDGDTTNAVATKAGLVTTTLARQLERQKLTAETVAAIAGAYGRDVLDALVIAGLITNEQIDRHAARATLGAATDKEIADEVWRRMNDGRDHPAID